MLGLKSSALDAIDGVSHRFFTAIGGTSPSPWRGLNTSYDVGDAPARVDEHLARVRFRSNIDPRKWRSQGRSVLRCRLRQFLLEIRTLDKVSRFTPLYR